MRSRVDNNGLIFSVFRSEKSLNDNLRSHEFIKDNLLKASGYKFKEVDGVYKDDTEKSFLIVDNNGLDDIKEIEKLVSDICEKYHQECYLKFDIRNNSWLIYPNGQEYIGVLTNVSEDQALGFDNYTYDSFTGYWVVK